MEKIITDLLASNDGKFPAFAWPGGYPLFYLCADNGILCPKCAEKEKQLISEADSSDKQWQVVGYDVNWEDDSMICDHCNNKIDPAYSE